MTSNSRWKLLIKVYFINLVLRNNEAGTKYFKTRS